MNGPAATLPRRRLSLLGSGSGSGHRPRQSGGLSAAGLVAMLAVSAGPACSGRRLAQSPQEAVEPSDDDGLAPAPASVVAGKSKARSFSKNSATQLRYRQASEQARQRLTAANAHLRLDELDAQIEREKESRP